MESVDIDTDGTSGVYMLYMQKMAAILQTTFSSISFWVRNGCILIQISLKCVPGSLNWKKVIIGSNNGLAPNRCQAITWTNDDKILWHHMVSLGHNELRSCETSNPSAYDETISVLATYSVADISFVSQSLKVSAQESGTRGGSCGCSLCSLQQLNTSQSNQCRSASALRSISLMIHSFITIEIQWKF